MRKQRLILVSSVFADVGFQVLGVKQICYCDDITSALSYYMKTKLLQSTMGARIKEVEKKAIQKCPQNLLFIYGLKSIMYFFQILVFLICLFRHLINLICS